MTGVCLTCGVTAELESHHVAGRHNDPDLIVPVCEGCHRVLTSWQYAAGLELHAHADRSEEDCRRALVVGVLHLVQLAARRHNDAADTGRAQLWQLTARAASRVLDLAAPPDRAGRWTPDAAIIPTEPPPVVADPASDEVRSRELVFLIAELLDRLGDVPPMTADLWRQLAADPRPIAEQLADLDVADHLGPSLTILIHENLEAMHRVVLWLLTVTDWDSIDEQDLDEVRVWLGVARALLDKIARSAA